MSNPAGDQEKESVYSLLHYLQTAIQAHRDDNDSKIDISFFQKIRDATVERLTVLGRRSPSASSNDHDDNTTSKSQSIPPNHSHGCTDGAPPTPSSSENSEASAPPSPFLEEMTSKLKSVFHLDHFRENQSQAIIALLQGQDALVLMPTGSGKSLCYQMASICTSGCRRGVTIVISPLLALMDDQANQSRKLGIETLVWNGSSDPSVDLPSLEAGSISLLYTTPEKLVSNKSAQKVLAILYKKNLIARFAVDEAHCVPTWGPDFRDAYLKIDQLREMFPTVPIAAFTATATQGTRDGIVERLGLRNHLLLLPTSFNRPNLSLSCRPKVKPQKVAEIIKEKYNGLVGIIYCMKKITCESVAEALKAEDIKAEFYHADLELAERQRIVSEWQNGKITTVVATIAFGMGIDKADVRYVIHFDVPKSISAYYQETGRAGRDGKPADCILFHSFSELNKALFLIKIDKNTPPESKKRQRNEIWEIFRYIWNPKDCRREVTLKYFGEDFDPQLCGKKCDNCLDAAAVVVQDVPILAHAVVKLVLATQGCGVELTAIQLRDCLRGVKSGTPKGAPSLNNLEGYGDAKGIPEQFVDHLLRRLVLDKILVTGLEGGVVRPGTQVKDFLRTQTYNVEWRPTDSATAQRAARATEKASTMITARCRQRSPSVSSLEGDVDSDANDTRIVTQRAVGPPSECESISTNHPRHPSTSISISVTTRSKTQHVPSIRNNQTCSDPINLMDELQRVQDQIFRIHGVMVSNMLDDATFQALLHGRPHDYNSFETTILRSYRERMNEQEAVATMKRLWSLCGNDLLSIFITDVTSGRPIH